MSTLMKGAVQNLDVKLQIALFIIQESSFYLCLKQVYIEQYLAQKYTKPIYSEPHIQFSLSMSISQKDDGRSKNLVGSIIEQQGFVSIRTKNKPGGSQWPPWPTWFRRPCQVNTALSNFMHLYRICCLVMFTVHIEVNDHRAPLRLAPLCIVTVQASQNEASLFITDSKLL